MRLGFDLRPFLREETGVGVYFRNLLHHLADLDRENEYYLFSCSFKDRFPRRLLPRFARMRVLDLKIPVKLQNALWYRLGRPTLDAYFRTRLDLTHSPVPVVLPTRGKRVITVCDLFFLEHPELADRQARRDFVHRVGRAVRTADAVVTISEFSRRIILDRLGAEGSRVRAIPLGLDPDFGEAPPPVVVESTLRKFSLPGRFALFVGAFEPRKNIPRLVEAWRILWGRSPGTPLILAGRGGADLGAVESAILGRGAKEAVRAVGYVSRDELRALYALASLFVFPSLCEGFGLPLLEAMASGLPMAVSSASALPEVAGEAALYFDPLRAEDIAETAGRLLEDEVLRRDLAEKGRRRARMFRWGDTARRSLELYRSLV